MIRLKIFLMFVMAVMVSQVFAEFNITDTFAIDANGNPSVKYTADISDPNITLSSTTVLSEGGAAAIAAYGATLGDGDFVSWVTVANNGGNSYCGLLGNFNIATMSGYYFEFDYYSSKAYLVKIDAGVSTPLISTSSTYSASESYILEFRYDNDLTDKLTGKL